MKSFDYLTAETLDAALSVYNDQTLKAGGVDLLDSMKERLQTPDTVLSIETISDLDYLRADGDVLRIGCMTSLAKLGRSSILQKHYPSLAKAAGHAATPQVRERASIGGNLCQRPRCWYFRNHEFDCLKKGGYTCFAVEGENQYHAIFGDGPCHIVHPSNCAIALLALDADLILRHKTGQRQIKAADFFVMPDESLKRENSLRDGEILTEIILPERPSHSATIELREKQSFDWPMVMASAARIRGTWRICLGAVAPIPWLSQPAMKILGDREMTVALAEQAADAAVEGAAPMTDNGYKIKLVKVTVKRCLLAAAGLETF